MDEPAEADANTMISALTARLAASGRKIPDHAVGDAVHAVLAAYYPREDPDKVRIPAHVADALLAELSGTPPGVPKGPAAMPAVLSEREVAVVVAALGVAVHLATFNLTRDRLRVTAALAGAATALWTLGAAPRTALTDGTGAVLLSPAALHAAGTTLTDVSRCLGDHDWQAGNLDRPRAEAIIADAVTVLGSGT